MHYLKEHMELQRAHILVKIQVLVSQDYIQAESDGCSPTWYLLSIAFWTDHVTPAQCLTVQDLSGNGSVTPTVITHSSNNYMDV